MKNAEESEWIKRIIELLRLDKRSIFERLLRRAKYEYLLVFGGMLLHVRARGVIWLSKAYINGLLSKAGVSSAIMHKVGALLSFTVPGGGFIYDVLKDRIWREPTAEPQQYLLTMIDRVEYGSFTVNPTKKIDVVAQTLKSFFRRVKHEQRVVREAPFHLYFLRFIDKIVASREEREVKLTLKTFVPWITKKIEKIPTYRCRDKSKLLKFIEGLRKDGFNVVERSKLP